jgi:hypothetical protein
MQDKSRILAFKMSGETIVGLVIGAIAGVLGNLLVGYLFYQRSGTELKHEAGLLREETGQTRRLVDVLAHALESAGAIQVTWDDKGNLHDFVVKARTVPLAAEFSTPIVLKVSEDERLKDPP